MKKTATPENSVTLTSKPEDKLSTEQRAYADLLKRIERQEKRIAASTQKVIELREAHHLHIISNIEKQSQIQLDLALAIGQAAKNQYLNEEEKLDLGNAIMFLLQEANGYIDLDEQHIALFNEWSPKTYEEIEKEETEEAKAEMKQDLKGFGIDVDLDESDTIEEAQAKIFAKILENREELRNKFFETNDFLNQDEDKPKPKTKKQLEKEAMLMAEQQAAEELRGKTIRSIYIGLAKVLHPDTASDMLEKSQKEELMKQVTVAYEKKDLPTLLQLEAKWVEGQTQEISKLSNDKIRIYISFLKERLSSLHQEEQEVLRHPSNNDIREYLALSLKRALKEMELNSRSIIANMGRFQSMLKIKSNKASLMSVVKKVNKENVSKELDLFQEFFRTSFFG